MWSIAPLTLCSPADIFIVSQASGATAGNDHADLRQHDGDKKVIVSEHRVVPPRLSRPTRQPQGESLRKRAETLHSHRRPLACRRKGRGQTSSRRKNNEYANT